MTNLNHTKCVIACVCFYAYVMLKANTLTHSSGKIFNNKCWSEKDTENIRLKTGKSMYGEHTTVHVGERSRVKTNLSRCQFLCAFITQIA